MIFISDFLSHFFGDLILPDWAIYFGGLVLLTLFFKLIFCLLGK